MPFVRWQSGSALRCPAPASPVREAALGELDDASWGPLGLLRESFEGQQDLLGPSLGAEQHPKRFRRTAIVSGAWLLIGQRRRKLRVCARPRRAPKARVRTPGYLDSVAFVSGTHGYLDNSIALGRAGLFFAGASIGFIALADSRISGLGWLRLQLGCQGTIGPAWHPKRFRRTASACGAWLVIGRRQT